MTKVQVDKDYEEISRSRRIKLGGDVYHCATGCFELDQAEKEAKIFTNRGHKKVKIIVCRAYFVCVPEEEQTILGIHVAGAEKVVKDAAKTIKKANRVVNHATGDILTRHDRGTNAVKKFLRW